MVGNANQSLYLSMLCLYAWVGGVLWAGYAGAADLRWDTAAEWKTWNIPAGVSRVTPDGWVEVGGIRKGINAALNATQFSYERGGRPQEGGVREVGSNPRDAGNLIDGQRSTYWAPDPDDGVEKWWLELDLGRAVTATALRLIFPPDRVPLPQFKIFVSDGRKRFEFSPLENLFFELIYETKKDQRENLFQIDLEERDRAGDLLMGKVIQYIRIAFLKKVGNAALAEIEVDAIGDNIALATKERGGFTISGEKAQPGSHLFDGLFWTSWETPLRGDPWAEPGPLGVGGWVGSFLQWDLGSQFWVDSIRVLGRTKEAVRTDMDGFRLYVSDGTTTTRSADSVWRLNGRDLQWEQVADVNNNANNPRLLKFDIGFKRRRVRYLFLHHFYGFTSEDQHFVRGGNGGLIFEMQIFGEGRSPGVTLTSPIIDLGTQESISSLTWGGTEPEGTSFRLRTRSGSSVEKTLHYFKKTGEEVSQAVYEQTPKFRRGDIVEEIAPGSDWSGWSEPYEYSGGEFLSPSPRRFVQIEAQLSSTDPAVSPALDFIELNTVAALAQKIEGQIEPRAVVPGKRDTFFVTLKQATGGPARGLDGVLIRGVWQPEFVEVNRDRGEIEALQFSGDGDSLWVRFDRVVRRESVRVVLSGKVFANGSRIQVWAENSTLGSGVRQRVLEDEALKDALAIRLEGVAEGNDLIRDVMFSRRILTPNGDGVDDELELSFTIVKVMIPRQIRVRVYRLAGAVVREVFSEGGIAGEYRGVVWDGRDDSGRLVSPGLYVCEVHVQGDEGNDRVVRTIGVAY